MNGGEAPAWSGSPFEPTEPGLPPGPRVRLSMCPTRPRTREQPGPLEVIDSGSRGAPGSRRVPGLSHGSCRQAGQAARPRHGAVAGRTGPCPPRRRSSAGAWLRGSQMGGIEAAPSSREPRACPPRSLMNEAAGLDRAQTSFRWVYAAPFAVLEVACRQWRIRA